jgi:predicted transcriptional regulator
MSEDPNTTSLSDLTADVVSAYVSNNRVPVAELAPLIQAVYAALGSAQGGAVETPAEKLVPAVPVRKSITPDFLISLEDGKSYKSLKRHLSKYGITPADYRTKWGLPKDYPMVAASYSASRSAMAKSIGLGVKRKAAVAEAAPKPTTVKAPAKPRGRKPKAVPTSAA